MSELDIELRKLPPGVVYQLTRTLECGGGWKQLMALVPSADPSVPKYSALDISLVECASSKQKRPCSEIFLEEWGTSGRVRPHLSTLKDLLVKAELFQAADYVSVELLKEKAPERPKFGPAAAIKIPSTTEIISLPTPLSETTVTLTCQQETQHSIQNKDTTPITSLSENAGNGIVGEYPFSELYDGTGGFSNKARLGGGAFGDVYLCDLGTQGQIAVKRLKVDIPGGGDPNRLFTHEISTLASVEHSHLLTLLGYCTTGPALCLVYSYMPNGSLLDKLEIKEDVLSWEQRLLIAQGTADGINHLHTFKEKPLVHRDVKSANILLDGNLNPKVGDFGLVRAGASGEKSVAMTTTVVGTSAYMAPEAFRGDVSAKMDVFSFGVVLLELITGLPPFDEEREGCDLASHVEEVDNIDSLIDPHLKPSDVPKKMYKLAEQCLLEKKNRPNMGLVYELLVNLNASS